MPSRSTLPQRSRNEIIAQLASQFRYARFTPGDYLKDQALMRAVDKAPCITCGQFRAVAKRQGWTEDDVVAQCRGQIDELGRTIHRIMVTNPADTVIPYACMIEMYQKATSAPKAQPGERCCACGCGGKVRGKQRFATSACQRRAHRQRQVA